MVETSEEKFLRLANARMNKILKAIANLGNLRTTTYKHDKRAERLMTMKMALIDAVHNAIPDGDTEKKDEAEFRLQ